MGPAYRCSCVSSFNQPPTLNESTLCRWNNLPYSKGPSACRQSPDDLLPIALAARRRCARLEIFETDAWAGNLMLCFHLEVLIIAPNSHASLISNTISDESYPSFSSLKIKVESVEQTDSDPVETADILRKFSSRFTVSDFSVPVWPHVKSLTRWLDILQVGCHSPSLRLRSSTQLEALFTAK